MIIPSRKKLVDEKEFVKDCLKKWSKEEANFLKSLKGKSRKELIELLNHHWNEHQGHKMVSEQQEGLIKRQNRLIKILERSGQKLRAVSQENLKGTKADIKRIEYLEQILKQERQKKKTNLDKGRIRRNEIRRAESQEIERKLTDAISSYFSAHSDRKIGNKAIVAFLDGKGFVGKGAYTQTTFEKKVAIIASIERKKKRQASGS